MNDEEKIARCDKLESELKTILTVLEIWSVEREEKGQIICDDVWNVKEMLQSTLGDEHWDFAGFGFEFVLKIWLVLEVWKDGKVIPRCMALTEKRAETVKDMLIHEYESIEPSQRPLISIEHQRMQHVFGYEMKRGRVRRYQGMRPREW